jgi:nucleoside-diphosphate-sugar epimerase
MVAEQAIRRRFRLIEPHLDERLRRLVAAAEVAAAGAGGVSAVARATGVSRRAIRAGAQELKRRGTAALAPGRIRRPGGGRKRTIDQDPTLLTDLEQLIEPTTRSLPIMGTWTLDLLGSVPGTTVIPIAPEVVVGMLTKGLAVRLDVQGGLRWDWCARALEALRRLDRPCAAVMVTSDKCYENREQVWGYREDDHLGEHDPYGASKGAAELVIRAYRESFFPLQQIARHGVKLASARAGNVIGGGDWTSDALIVDVVTALSRGKPIAIRNPGALRPWQHVLQALSGYLALAAALLRRDDPSLCSGWNIGPLPGNEIPVRELVELFIEQWGSGSWIDRSDPASPRESNILRLCIDKALWQLSWKPCWSIQQVLRHTADWYCSYFNGDQMQQCSFQQITMYEAAMQEALKPCLTSSQDSFEVRQPGAMQPAS